MEVIDIEQHRLIVKNCKELIRVSLENDIDYLQKIMNKSVNVIDNYNNKNFTVVDVTKRESGLWKSATKNVIYGKFLNPIINNLDRCHKDFLDEQDKYFTKKKYDIKQEFKKACDDTIFCKDLQLKYILLNRRSPYENKSLFTAIKETIHTEVLKTFQNQNQELITKYI